MLNPRGWWWGLPPLALVWVVTQVVMTPVIEAEIAARAGPAVAARHPWAAVRVEGRDAAISGLAAGVDRQLGAVAAVADVWGVREVADSSGLLAEARPFVWAAERTAEGLLLSGAVPPEGGARHLLSEAARLFPGVKVIDRTSEARGAPSASAVIATYALSQLSRLQFGTVSLADTQLALSGVAFDAAASKAVLDALRLPPSPIAVVSSAIGQSAPPPARLPVERPFVWRAHRSGETVTLTGSVPSEAARGQIAGQIRSTMPALRIVDHTKLATGMPPDVDFGRAARFALAQLAQLKSGHVRLSDGRLKADGEAVDTTAHAAVTAALVTALPSGLTLEKAAIAPPRVADYVWRLRSSAGQVTLGGHYPDAATRAVIVAGVRKARPAATIDERMVIAAGAPAGFEATAALAIEQLALVDDVSAEIAGGRLVLAATAPSEEVAEAVRAALGPHAGRLPAEARIAVRPQPAPVAPGPPPAAAADDRARAPSPPPERSRAPSPVASASRSCVDELARATDGGRITFANARAAIERPFRRVIEITADVMRRCPDLRLRVAGHTDSSGPGAANQWLSLRRAETAVDALVKAGVDRSRLQAEGRGPSHPIAGNATPAGRARNRRIELVVLE